MRLKNPAEHATGSQADRGFGRIFSPTLNQNVAGRRTERVVAADVEVGQGRFDILFRESVRYGHPVALS